MASTLPTANPCCDNDCSGLSVTVVTLGLSVLAGHGSPEGQVTGTILGQPYTDLDTGNFYKFAGVVGTKTGWI